MEIRNKRDFWAGVLFVVAGLAFFSVARQYEMGTLSRMGPGWFPTVLGVVLALLGVIVLVGAMAASAERKSLPRFRARELLLVTGAVAVFAALVPMLGLVLAAVLLLLIAAAASHEFRLIETLMSILALVGLCYWVFVRGLGLQLSAWPPMLTGS
ncbi:MAG: tripartite tricarboxylate transporter TctB family protein [Burkholderiaceae bacterium]